MDRMDNPTDTPFRPENQYEIFFELQILSAGVFLVTIKLFTVIEYTRPRANIYLSYHIIFTSYLFTMYVANRRFWE